jgi:hypothetical protein
VRCARLASGFRRGAKAPLYLRGNSKGEDESKGSNSKSKMQVPFGFAQGRLFDFALRAPLRITRQKKMAAASSELLRAKCGGASTSLRFAWNDTF